MSNPLELKEFSSAKTRIAYIDQPPMGDDRAEPILLVHGFASTHAVNWVFPLWVKYLAQDGRRVIALDVRGHGRSQKFYHPADYAMPLLAGDCLDLLDHLNIVRADLMGYSMGSRVCARLACDFPERVRSLVIGGLGEHLVDGGGLPQGLAQAMETDRPDLLTDPQQKTFRTFAEATKSDLKALAACIRGARAPMPRADVARIEAPTLICIGSKDDVAGDPGALAALMSHAEVVDIPNRDHNRAVGDPVFRAAALKFLAERG